MNASEGSGLQPHLGASACLLGHTVRYDGGHKCVPFLAEVLARFVKWVPVCPEMEAGLGCPREPMQLVGKPVRPQLVGKCTGRCFTPLLESYCERKLAELAQLQLDGFVLKSRSPSCGLRRVPVYDPCSRPLALGQGIFARHLQRAFPLLPLAQEEELARPGMAREAFLERAFAHRRLAAALAAPNQPAALLAFHSQHKLQLLAHSPALYRQLGRLMARAGQQPWEELCLRYAKLFLTALSLPPTRGRQRNVLQHAAGYLRGFAPATVQQELARAIERYGNGCARLKEPIALLREAVERHGAPTWLRTQTYLEPYPAELGPRHFL